MPSHGPILATAPAPFSGTYTTAGLRIRHEKRRPSSIPIEGQRALTGHFEGTKITKVLPVNPSTTEDVDYIVDHRSGVALSWGRNEADAGQLGPRPGVGVERPSIIVVVLAVCCTEPGELV